MRQSRRARRMERHYISSKKVPAFNIVSLMDIFTILVFFLLVNSAEVQKIPTTKAVELPESVTNENPNESIVVMVTPTEILVENEPVASVSDLRETQTATAAIDALQAALQSQSGIKQVISITGEKLPPEVTVLGDKTTPYNLLHKVMQAATGAGIEKVSLAVLQKVPEEG